MVKSSLCDYSDGQILVNRAITAANAAAADTDANNTNVKVIFENYTPFEKYKYATDLNNT